MTVRPAASVLPVPPGDTLAFRLIRQHTTTPLAVGEIFNTLWDCKDLIQGQLIDYIRATVVGAGGGQLFRQKLKRSGDFGRRGQERMFGDDQDPEVREFLAPRGRQAQPIGASLGRLVGAGDCIERQDEVVD